MPLSMNLVLLTRSDFTDETLRRVRMSGRRFTHLTSVVRVRPGDRIRVGCIDGPLGTGLVTGIDPRSVELEVDLSDPPPPPLPLTLLIALPRPKSLKKAIEAAASLGIKRIYIIESWRVEKSYWNSPALAPGAIREHLLLGLEQARDTVMPRVELRRRFKPFVEDELPGIASGALPFVAHPYEAQPCPSDIFPPAILAIGPEGGFIPYEIECLKKNGFTPVTIGPRILRVEIAIPAFAGRLVSAF